MNKTYFSFGVVLGMIFIFVLTFIFFWCIKNELLNNFYILGNELNKTTDINQTLSVLISENKLISAKDFFGFYLSYYNNFIIILSCIIGVFSIVSFFYIKNKSEDINEEIKIQTKEHLEKMIDLKKTIKEVTDNSARDIIDRMEKLEKDVEKLKNFEELSKEDITKELDKNN